jgi:hypothetical protein
MDEGNIEQRIADKLREAEILAVPYSPGRNRSLIGPVSDPR